ncbi:MAG: hypothetical protein QXT77_00125 [Candidatus Methanomethylicaceae archaeon]
MKELLRSVFIEDVPAWHQLEPKLRQWLSDPNLDLSDIRELIYEHIFEYLEEAYEDPSDAADEAMNRAFSVIDGLIENLPVDELNCERLKAYIGEMDCYKAYDRLLTDYRELLSAEEYQQILAKGKHIFIPEVTSHWQ